MEHSRSIFNADLVVLEPPPSRSSKASRSPTLSLAEHLVNEKAPATTPFYPLASSSSQNERWPPFTDTTPVPVHSYPARTSHISQRSSANPCCHRKSGIASNLRPWFPIIMYATTSFAFFIAFAFYKSQLFQCVWSLSFAS